jgi:uncharacterized membrane protein YwaF
MLLRIILCPAPGTVDQGEMPFHVSPPLLIVGSLSFAMTRRRLLTFGYHG